MPVESSLHVPGRRVAAFVLAISMLSGCGKKPEQPATDNAFDTPEAAVSAFVAAVEKYDMPRLQALLGPGATELLDSGDSVQDAGDRAEFLAAYAAKHSLTDDGADRKVLVVGEQDWPLPIPLVKYDGNWAFDGEAGIDEMIYRRVGRNELGAIDVCRGFVDAQFDYAAEGRDDGPAGVYALKLVSDTGLHNGLYWPVEEGETPSPAGEFVAAAADEGYRRTEGTPTPYHGYYYRMLYAQGPNANGGARDYFKDGLLTEGFALVAWPADYGSSGVMTFIVNQDGVVYQKNLGPDTERIARQMKEYDPDPGWKAN
jgi:hypothetical protein